MKGLNKIKKHNFFILLLVLSIPFLHEIGHYIGYHLDGIKVHVSYSAVYHESNSKVFYGIIGGPLFNILLSTTTLILSYVNNKNALFWSSLSFASSFSRLLVNILILTISIFNVEILFYNDGGKISDLLGFSSYYIYFFSIIIYILLILKLLKNTTYLNIFKKIAICSVIFTVIIIFF